MKYLLELIGWPVALGIALAIGLLIGFLLGRMF